MRVDSRNIEIEFLFKILISEFIFTTISSRHVGKNAKILEEFVVAKALEKHENFTTVFVGDNRRKIFSVFVLQHTKVIELKALE